MGEINKMPFQRPAYQRKEIFSALGQSKNWGIDMFQVPELWKYSKGKGVKIAILDTGATDPAHVDLQGAYVACRNFTSDKPGSFIDRDCHGTGVAGIIGARDNEFGVVGIAPECSLYAAKVLRDDGTGDERFIIDAIEWAIEMKVDIINMSFGTRKQPNKALQDVIRKAYSSNITLFGAAGNVGEEGNLDTIDWPAKYPEVISVGAISRDQLRSTFSSVGQRIDLLAPGEDILTTVLNNDYAVMSGTSFACPFAAAVAALCIASHRQFPSKTPCETPTQVREHLLKTAIDVGAPGWDREDGFGIIHPISLFDMETIEKSEVVGNFRVSNRVIPELQYIKARKKIDPIRVCQLNMNFTVETFDGEQNGFPGDFLAVDGKGAVFIISKKDFTDQYELI
jgi:subtilisin family serine protease